MDVFYSAVYCEHLMHLSFHVQIQGIAQPSALPILLVSMNILGAGKGRKAASKVCAEHSIAKERGGKFLTNFLFFARMQEVSGCLASDIKSGTEKVSLEQMQSILSIINGLEPIPRGQYLKCQGHKSWHSHLPARQLLQGQKTTRTQACCVCRAARECQRSSFGGGEEDCQWGHPGDCVPHPCQPEGQASRSVQVIRATP